jgi:hypothetical protein
VNSESQSMQYTESQLSASTHVDNNDLRFGVTAGSCPLWLHDDHRWMLPVVASSIVFRLDGAEIQAVTHAPSRA